MIEQWFSNISENTDMAALVNYKRNLAKKAVAGLPVEDIVYAVFVDIITLYKTPPARFTIYSQMSLKWKPADAKDRCSEVPDVGIGNFTGPGFNPPFKLCCRVKAKHAIPIMSDLPNPTVIRGHKDLALVFHKLYFQAKDQAKATYKNHYPLSEEGVQWILLVGPYWTLERLGPSLNLCWIWQARCICHHFAK
jgi:hypothetical protein